MEGDRRRREQSERAGGQVILQAGRALMKLLLTQQDSCQATEVAVLKQVMTDVEWVPFSYERWEISSDGHGPQ